MTATVVESAKKKVVTTVLPTTSVKKTATTTTVTSKGGTGAVRAQQKVPPGSATKTTAIAGTKGPVKPTISSLEKEIEKLREQISRQEGIISRGRQSMAYSYHVVGALGITIRYLSEQLSAFSTPLLNLKLEISRKQIAELEQSLKEKEEEYHQLHSYSEEREQELLDEINRWRRQVDQERLKIDREREQLSDGHSREVRALEDKYDSQVREYFERERDLLTSIEGKDRIIREKSEEVKRLHNDVKELETMSGVKMDKSKKVKDLQDKLKNSQCEVESLHAVLELRDDKIRTLNRQVMELEESVKEVPTFKQTISVLRQKIEQLESSLSNKNDQIRELFQENQSLQYLHEDSIREKKRLSLRNEELQFALSEQSSFVIPGHNPQPSIPSTPSVINQSMATTSTSRKTIGGTTACLSFDQDFTPIRLPSKSRNSSESGDEIPVKVGLRPPNPTNRVPKTSRSSKSLTRILGSVNPFTPPSETQEEQRVAGSQQEAETIQTAIVKPSTTKLRTPTGTPRRTRQPQQHPPTTTASSNLDVSHHHHPSDGVGDNEEGEGGTYHLHYLPPNYHNTDNNDDDTDDRARIVDENSTIATTTTRSPVVMRRKKKPSNSSSSSKIRRETITLRTNEVSVGGGDDPTDSPGDSHSDEKKGEDEQLDHQSHNSNPPPHDRRETSVHVRII